MSKTIERPTPLDALADRIDRLADAQPAGSQAQADLYAAATVWRKHLLGPQSGPRDDWRPIESAPKDQLICIWITGEENGQRWNDDHGEIWTHCYYDTICGEWRTSRPSGYLSSVPERFVTHWRPLPAPPVHVSDDAHAISDAMRMTDDGEIREVRAPASRSDGGIRYDAMMEHGLSIFSEGSPAARTDGDVHDGSEA